jgi:hypothetical protein
MGRELNQAELRDIERRVNYHMRSLSRANPSEWAGKSEDERLTEAGVAAAREIVTEARRRKDNLERRVIRLSALNDFVDRDVAEARDNPRQAMIGGGGITGAALNAVGIGARAPDLPLRSDAVSRIFAPTAGKESPESGAVDQVAQGAYGDAVRSLVDVFEAGKRRGIWRFIPFNEPGTNALLRRALAGITENVPAEFTRMAKLAHDYIDLMRRRYNAAGGAVGRLEDWGEPHRWSDILVIREAKRRGNGDIEAGRKLIAKDFAQAAVRQRYVHEDGRMMSTEEVIGFMDEALRTITTDGANKRLRGETAEYSQSVTANRHRAHREIHIRPDAVEALLGQYSEMGAMESLLLHMRSIARDVALIETLGPNSELTAEQLIQRAYDEDLSAFPDKKNHLQTIRDHNQYLFDYIAGNANGRRNGLNATASFLRSWATFKSLGSTVWASLTDPVNMQHVAAARGLDAGRLFINDLAMFVGNGRRWAKRAGLITDTVAGYADRFNFDNLAAPDIGARAASFTMKVTGLNWVTEARRAAFGLTFMDAVGHLVRHNESIGNLKDADDAAILSRLNIDENTWAVWRLAKLESRGSNRTVLSTQSIYAIPDADITALFPGADAALTRNRAATALLGIIKDETNTAIITAGSRERAAMLGDQTKSGAGTLGGELRRSVLLFRSFPWTFMSRQWDLAKSIDGGGNRAAYAASLIVSTWAMGVLINWIYDLKDGRDPGAIDPQSAEGRRNIIAGLMRGGGLGFFGDFLFANSDPSGRSQSLTSSLSGPIVSQIDEVQQLTLGNLNQEAAGEDSNFGPEAVTFAQRQVAPNWWWSNSILQRYIFNALQEEIEPGYNARRMQRQFNNRGTTYYWNPAEPEDIRAPDWSRAVEGDMPERAN